MIATEGLTGITNTSRNKKMNDHLLIAICLIIVGIVVVQDDGFEHRWCETYPDWCMPVAGDELEEWKNDNNQRIVA